MTVAGKRSLRKWGSEFPFLTVRLTSCGRMNQRVEPWDDEVDGIDLLNEIRTLIQSHLIVQTGVDIIIPLWVLLTYCFDEFRILPQLDPTTTSLIPRGPNT